MKDVMNLETTREFDIAEQAYAHGMSQGMLNTAMQFLNGQLDKEWVREVVEAHDIEVTDEVHIGDGVLHKDNPDDSGAIVGVRDGKFLVAWHYGSFNESETYEEPSDLVKEF